MNTPFQQGFKAGYDLKDMPVNPFPLHQVVARGAWSVGFVRGCQAAINDKILTSNVKEN